MCGLAGFFASNKHDEHQYWLENMLSAIEHRGPDSIGTWNHCGLYLGHQRLAIHDLSSFGHQPMISKNSRYIIVFNGEIYNFETLRKELPQQAWRGTSDTEVMLAAFEQWGVDKAIEKFNGMFAFALWDQKLRELMLVRDRFGEKPLYYIEQNGFFAFSSELTSIETLPELTLTINRDSLLQHTNYSYIPAPNTVYKQVNKLAPGTLLRFNPKSGIKITSYWRLNEVIEKAKADPVKNEQEAIDLLDVELRKSIKMRMSADVPLGAFLSGGIDSSMVVSLMQELSDKPINTFSIGFNVPSYNEAEYAKEISAYLDTKHHEQYLELDQLIDLLSQIGKMFDEPFSDVSQLPTYLVSALAKKKVTVCLTGDGGDELFAGYNRYQSIPEIWKIISRIPARKLCASALEKIPVAVLNRLFFFLQSRAKKYGSEGQIGTKIKKLTQWMKADGINEFYLTSMTHLSNDCSLVLDSHSSDFIRYVEPEVINNVVEMFMYYDSLSYLPGDILTKVDRTAMQVSLEGRIPFLDHNVAELAWRMPISMKIKDGESKWVLKQVLYRYLPKSMMDRPKTGFSVPIDLWLRESLREWAQDLLSYDRLVSQNLYNPKTVQNILNSHLRYENNNATLLWDILMMQSWLDADFKRKNRI